MIDKLKSLNIINDELKSIYEFDEYTLTELLCQFYNSITDVIDECNILEESYNYLLNQGLPLEVQKEITNMYNDGRLANIINNVVLDEVNRKIDNQKYIYVSLCIGETSEERLLYAKNNKCNKIIFIDEDITLTSIIEFNENTHIEGNKINRILLNGGYIQLQSNSSIRNCVIENTVINNNLNGSRGIQVLHYFNDKITENVLIEGNTIKNCFYNIDCRMNQDYPLIMGENLRILNNNSNVDYSYGDDINCGNIIVQSFNNVIIEGNIVSGGTVSSAIGVTCCCGKVIVNNNIVKNNKEASIQIETFPTYGHSENEQIRQTVNVSNNFCDNGIWTDDTSNVIIENNICGNIYNTIQQFNVDTVIIRNNITGVIRNASVYTPTEGVTMKNVIIENNVCKGNNGSYVDCVVANSNSFISLSSIVKSAKIINNTFDKNNIHTYGVSFNANGTDYEYIIYGNTNMKNYYNVTGTNVKLQETTDKSIVVPRYKTTERPLYSDGNLSIGSTIYDIGLGKLITLKSANVWVDSNGNEV